MTSAPTISVETTIAAPLARVWSAYTTPEDIVAWNAASEDWHTTRAVVDLRDGGAFLSRMEAKDGSMGFDFAGTYSKIIPQQRIDYAFGDRTAQVTFDQRPEGVKVHVAFVAEQSNPIEMQRGGWQAILDNFKRYVEAKSS
ncbi:MAG: SRPBCC family protein [Alphaproteobacteria bacterium]|nr:SRPBCC family protein [Alphaproteobacteria bacterium]